MATALAQDIEIPAGPFSGVFDSSDPKMALPTRLFDAVNMRVPDPKNGSAVVARDGMQGQTTQLGSGTDRMGQCVFKHRRLDGTIDRFTFGGGKMYRWDGGIVFTDISPVGIKIDLTNPVFCATFNDEVIVSDENNKPWIYTPSTGAAVVIEYNDVHDEWSTKGGASIYSGYPFFIVKALGMASLTTESGDIITTEDGLEITTELLSGLQNSITWGNANDARTGYDQGAFDHVWTLTQTSSEVLGSLFAEEGHLIYLRNEGIGYMTGPVTDDFRGSATKDGISATRGTDAPAAVVAVDKWCYFPDLDGRLFRCIAGGGEPEELWFPVRRQIEANFGLSANRANVTAYARGAYHPAYDMVLFTIWDRTTLYGFDARTGRYVGTWSIAGGVHITALGSTVDSSNRSTFVALGTRSTTYQGSDLGVFWRQKFADDTMRWLDTADAAVASHTALTRVVETHWLVDKVAAVFRAMKVAAHLIADSVAHAVQLEYIVPKSGKSTAITAQSSAVTGEKSTTDSIATARWGLGRNAQGGAIRLRLSATHSDNVQFGVHSLSVRGVLVKARPKAA